jgi:hypothetical protein
MARRTYTGEELIESVRNLGMIPNTGPLGGKDEDILLNLNEYFSLYMMPLLVSLREEYYVRTTRIAISGTTLRYRMPDRAIGEKLRMIRYVASDGHMDDAPLPEISPERQGDYTWDATGRPSGWYLEGNHICLVASSVSGSLEVSWYFRPGQIVKSTAARKLTAVDLTARTVDSATAFPAAWTTGDKFDVHSYKSGAEVKVWDMVITALTTSPPYRITFSAANPIDGSTRGTYAAEVGDWICLAGEAAIPALPVDMHPLLVEAGNIRTQAGLGKIEAVKIHHELMKEAEASILKVVKKRVEGHSKRILGRRGLLWKQGRGW